MLIVNPSTWTSWDLLINMATEHLVECPRFVIQHHMKRAAREFFKRSGIWRSEDGVLLTTVDGIDEYVHTAPANAELSRLYSAWNGDQEIAVGQQGEYANSSASESPGDFSLEVRGSNAIWASPAPTGGVVVRGIAVYIPSNIGVGIPAQAADEWGNQIACGAAARLVMQPQRGWSNPALHPWLVSEFDAACREASVQGGRVARTPMRVKSW